MRIEEITCGTEEIPPPIRLPFGKWFAQVIYPEIRAATEQIVPEGESVWFKFNFVDAQPIEVPGIKLFYRVELHRRIIIVLDDEREVPVIVPDEIRITFLDTDV